MRRRSHTPLDNQPVIIDDEPSSEEEKLEEDMKPLIVPEKIPKLDENVSGTCVIRANSLLHTGENHLKDIMHLVKSE